MSSTAQLFKDFVANPAIGLDLLVKTFFTHPELFSAEEKTAVVELILLYPETQYKVRLAHCTDLTDENYVVLMNTKNERIFDALARNRNLSTNLYERLERLSTTSDILPSLVRNPKVSQELAHKIVKNNFLLEEVVLATATSPHFTMKEIFDFRATIPKSYNNYDGFREALITKALKEPYETADSLFPEDLTCVPENIIIGMNLIYIRDNF